MTDPPAPPAPPARTFTQAEVDQIVARQRREWQERLDAATQERDTAQARVSELEPALAERDTLKGRVEELEPAVNRGKVEMALLAEAVRAGARHPDDLTKIIDRTDVRLEDGKVVGVEQAIAAAQKNRPDYFQSPAAPPSDGGARPASAPPPQEQAHEAINNAIRHAAGHAPR